MIKKIELSEIVPRAIREGLSYRIDSVVCISVDTSVYWSIWDPLQDIRNQISSSIFAGFRA